MPADDDDDVRRADVDHLALHQAGPGVDECRVPSVGDWHRMTCSCSDSAGEIPSTSPLLSAAPSTASCGRPGQAPVMSVQPARGDRPPDRPSQDSPRPVDVTARRVHHARHEGRAAPGAPRNESGRRCSADALTGADPRARARPGWGRRLSSRAHRRGAPLGRRPPGARRARRSRCRAA